MANCNRDPKRKSTPYKPSEFDPFTPPPPPLTPEQKQSMAEAFVQSWRAKK